MLWVGPVGAVAVVPVWAPELGAAVAVRVPAAAPVWAVPEQGVPEQGVPAREPGAWELVPTVGVRVPAAAQGPVVQGVAAQRLAAQRPGQEQRPQALALAPGRPAGPPDGLPRRPPCVRPRQRRPPVRCGRSARQRLRRPVERQRGRRTAVRQRQRQRRRRPWLRPPDGPAPGLPARPGAGSPPRPRCSSGRRAAGSPPAAGLVPGSPRERRARHRTRPSWTRQQPCLRLRPGGPQPRPPPVAVTGRAAASPLPPS